MFLSIVHWTCINKKTHCTFALWRGKAKNCGIFNNFWVALTIFWVFLIFLIFLYANKLVNSSLLKQLSVNIFRWLSWSEHFTSSIGTPLLTLNWLEGSALLVIDGSLSVIHVKLGIFHRFCPLFPNILRICCTNSLFQCSSCHTLLSCPCLCFFARTV